MRMRSVVSACIVCLLSLCKVMQSNNLFLFSFRFFLFLSSFFVKWLQHVLMCVTLFMVASIQFCSFFSCSPITVYLSLHSSNVCANRKKGEKSFINCQKRKKNINYYLRLVSVSRQQRNAQKRAASCHSVYGCSCITVSRSKIQLKKRKENKKVFHFASNNAKLTLFFIERSSISLFHFFSFFNKKKKRFQWDHITRYTWRNR